MTLWEERITESTTSAIVNEHVVRYSFASPIIRESGLWVDLGCGTGIAAAEGLGEPFRGKLVLVDLDKDALDEAQQRFPAAEVVAVQIDLASSDQLDDLKGKLLASKVGEGCITCFEVIDHLPNFVPLLNQLVDLSQAAGLTVALSVPNDAFWGLENPNHETIWSGEAFEEFRQNLPDDHVLAHQFVATGSCLQPADAGSAIRYQPSLDISSNGVPSHYVAAFGPQAGRLEGVARLVQTDLDRQRAWERQREADLAFYRARESDLLYHEERANELERRLSETARQASPE